MIIEFNQPNAPDALLCRLRRSALNIRSCTTGKVVVCAVGILQGGLFTHSEAADIDRLIWTQAFTNLCLQEAYSKPHSVETLYFAGQTPNSVCGCGGELMGATLTVEESAFYSVNRQMRGDTKIRWRKGLVECLSRSVVPPQTDVVKAATLG